MRLLLLLAAGAWGWVESEPGSGPVYPNEEMFRAVHTIRLDVQ